MQHNKSQSKIKKNGESKARKKGDITRWRRKEKTRSQLGLKESKAGLKESKCIEKYMYIRVSFFCGYTCTHDCTDTETKEGMANPRNMKGGSLLIFRL
jgi:hypothetical protein